MLRKVLLIIQLLFLFSSVLAQPEWDVFSKAMKSFGQDSQLTHADNSFCAIDVSNGDILFQINPHIPLAPASTIKTYTTAAALEYLHKDYVYTTDISFRGIKKGSIAYGQLIIKGNGDPSLGSDRFSQTSSGNIFKKIDQALKAKGITGIRGEIIFRNPIPHDSSCSEFWLEEDYGNYYGAGVYEFNWKENKFDITVDPTPSGFVVSSNQGGVNNEKDFCMQLQSKEGAGTDEAFAYVSRNDSCLYALKGFLTASKGKQVLSLACLDPQALFVHDFKAYFGQRFQEEKIREQAGSKEFELLQLLSPPLTELVYACNQKSLNLYAETFCKSVGFVQSRNRSWESGLKSMLDFASSLNINHHTIRLKDGSGLSPQDSITTSTMATLLYAYRVKPWWSDFYRSLPLINQINMKRGYIGGTRSYAGYMTLKSGKQIAFAWIVHGYSGNSKMVKDKMFKVLDTLKP